MDEPGGLTAVEAAERSRLLAVENYRVELDLTGLADTDTFESRTTITFSCAEPGATTWADLAAEQVLAVELNGVAVEPVMAADRLALPQLPASNRLVVEARHRESGRNHGLRRSVDDSDGEVYAWTHFEPWHARRVFACFDQPDLKASYDVTVRAPASWTCIANGPAESVHDDGDSRTWQFARTPRLPTYVIAVCAGPFHRVSRSRDGVQLGVYARRSLREHLERQADSVLEVAADALAYFGDAYGIAYPAAKLDQVYVPDFAAAMENFGCITYGDASLFRDDPTPAQRQRRGQVQLHEIAHMWFGDLVTMPWWDGLWLKEAFATMAASLAAPTVLGRADVWAGFAYGAESGVYAADQSPVTHPVQVPVPDVAAAESEFDAITYNKGLAALRQLVAVIGEDTFLRGMRSYFARYAGDTADLDALVAELEAASGRDLRSWVTGWVHESGPDTLAVRVDHSASGRRVRVEVSAPNGGDPRPHRLVLGHYRPESGGRLERIARIELNTVDGGTDAPLTEPMDDGDLLLLNDDDLTYAKVRLDDESLRTLLASGHALPTSLARAVGLLIVGDMLADGEVPARAAVPMAVGMLPREPDVSLLATLLSTTRDLIYWHAPDAETTVLEGVLAAGCLEALTEEPAGSQRWLTLAAGAASCAATAEQHAMVDRLLGPDTRRELRWSALTRKLATGVAQPEAVTAELSRDTDPDAAAKAAVARAAAGTEAAKAAALDALFDGRSVPVSALGEFGAAIWQRHQGELAQPFADAYVDRLSQASAALGPSTAGRIALSAFPRAGVDHALLDRAEALAADASTPPLVSKNVQVQTYRLRKALVARGI